MQSGHILVVRHKHRLHWYIHASLDAIQLIHSNCVFAMQGIDVQLEFVDGNEKRQGTWYICGPQQLSEATVRGAFVDEFSACLSSTLLE